MLRLKKSLGQNFLVDKNVINKIVSLDVIKDKKIFEIGPGSGNLTNYIIQKKPKTILLIEKDKRFYEILSKKYRFKKNYKIINEDILNYDLNKHKKEDAIIFGNLPYNISTQILAKFISTNIWPPFYKKIIFKNFYNFSDEIIVNSFEFKKKLKKILKLDSQVIYNPIALPRKIKKKKLIILAITNI